MKPPFETEHLSDEEYIKLEKSHDCIHSILSLYEDFSELWDVWFGQGKYCGLSFKSGSDIISEKLRDMNKKYNMGLVQEPIKFYRDGEN